MSAEGAQAVVGLLNKVIKYAVGLGVGASVVQQTLFNGARGAPDPCSRTGCPCWPGARCSGQRSPCALPSRRRGTAG
jgi:hypothetical protein